MFRIISGTVGSMSTGLSLADDARSNVCYFLWTCFVRAFSGGFTTTINADDTVGFSELKLKKSFIIPETEF